MSRDKLRGLTLGKAKQKSVIADFGGARYEIRQPSIKTKVDVTARLDASANDIVKGLEMLVWLVIKCTYVPGTDELVFEDADYEGLLGCPSGGFVEHFGNLALRLSDVNVAEKKDFLEGATTVN